MKFYLNGDLIEEAFEATEEVFTFSNDGMDIPVAHKLNKVLYDAKLVTGKVEFKNLPNETLYPVEPYSTEIPEINVKVSPNTVADPEGNLGPGPYTVEVAAEPWSYKVEYEAEEENQMLVYFRDKISSLLESTAE